MLKVAVIASTGGSVLNAVLGLPYMKERIRTVLSDRDCRAIDVAREKGIDVVNFACRDSQQFSNQLSEFFIANSHDLVVSFYTKIFRGNLLEQLYGRFINFHPSILPACPGMDGFGDTISSGAKFIGATVHLIDKGVDTGFPVVQSAFPFNPNIGIAENRHAVFVSQARMFIQVVRWYEQGRVRIDEFGRPCLVDGKYQSSEFSPNLDFEVALKFSA